MGLAVSRTAIRAGAGVVQPTPIEVKNCVTERDSRLMEALTGDTKQGGR
jgi:hypothetical protein